MIPYPVHALPWPPHARLSSQHHNHRRHLRICLHASMATPASERQDNVGRVRAHKNKTSGARRCKSTSSTSPHNGCQSYLCYNINFPPTHTAVWFRQSPVRPQVVFVDEAVERAVHGLDLVLVALHVHLVEHSLLVEVEVARRLPQVKFGHVRGVQQLIPAMRTTSETNTNCMDEYCVELCKFLHSRQKSPSNSQSSQNPATSRRKFASRDVDKRRQVRRVTNGGILSNSTRGRHKKGVPRETNRSKGTATKTVPTK